MMTPLSEELIKKYIKGILDALSWKQTVNDAVRETQILVNPQQRSQHETLITLQDNFDIDGNVYPETPLTYTNEERTQNEMRIYVRNEGISDKEKIAMVSIYFKVGSDLVDPENVFNKNLIEVIQMLVAREIWRTAGFNEMGTRYVPHPEMICQLSGMLKAAATIGRYAEALVELNLQLQNMLVDIYKYKHHLQSYHVNQRIKITEVVNLINIIERFSQSYDFAKLVSYINIIKTRYHTTNKIFKDKLVQIINNISDIITDNCKTLHEIKTPFLDVTLHFKTRGLPYLTHEASDTIETPRASL